MENNNNNYETSVPQEKVSKNSEEMLKDVLNEEKKAKEEKQGGKDKSKKDKKAEKAEKKKNGKKFNGKKLKHGTMATVLTCCFIAVLVLLNVVATTLFDRYPITIDLTKDKIYSVSDESEEYVKKVDTDVLVTVFANENTYTNYSEYNKQAVELLKNYCKLNHHISYRFVDIDSNPEIVKDYSDSVQSFDIIFETNTNIDGKDVKRTRKIGMIDMLTFSDEFTEQLSQSGMTIDTLKEQFEAAGGNDLTLLSYYGSYVESSNAEQAFTSALMTVTDPDPKYVTFLTGRSELTQLSYFQSLLTANGYNVNSIDITSQDIPNNTDVIVISAPKTDYLEDEITKISDFLNNDGNLGKQLIYVGSYSQEATPNLDEFLAEYGVKIGDGVICETYQGNYYNYPYVTTSSELSDSFNQDVETTDPKIMSALCRPVETLFDKQGMVSTEQYAKSTNDAYTAKINVANGGLEVGDKLSEGQKCYMAIGSKAKFMNDEDGTTLYSSVLAFGSEYILSDQYLSYSQYQNREYFMSVLNGITHKTDGVTITPKTVTGNVFDITQLQKNVLKWVFCLGVPVIVLVVGIVIWVRRKNK